MNKTYHYIGPHDLHQLSSQPSYRTQIAQPGDVLAWIDETHQVGSGSQIVARSMSRAPLGSLC